MSSKLKEKIESAQVGGAMNLSSADVSDFGHKKTVEPTAGDLTVKPTEKKDPLLEQGAAGNPGEALAGAADAADDSIEPSQISGAGYAALDQAIDITEDDREAFLDALVSGDRFTRPFSIYNGKIKGVFRSRSQRESYGVVAQLAHEHRAHPMSDMEYSVRLRNCLLASQVAELNSVECPPMQAPLQPVMADDGVKPAGWLGQADKWGDKDEAVVSAIYKELRKFERKYWTMVENADDQDFWQPAESSSE